MNTNIPVLNTPSRVRATEATKVDFRRPNYDCREQADTLKLIVYIPGVDSSGVEITASGPDLMITAKKKRFVRVNFDSLHLESAMRDYRLNLRLGNGLDFANLNAEIEDGILTLLIPKRSTATDFSNLRRAA